MVNNSTNINKTSNNLSPKESINWNYWPSLFKLSLGERLLFVLLILVMVNNSTNINKTSNNLSPKVSQTVMVNNSTNINKTNNKLSPKKGLNSDGQQFHQY